MTATIEGATFQPGDIVRVRDASAYGPAKGRRARVVGPHHSHSDMLNVEWLDADDEDDRDGSGWLIDRFELVEPEVKPAFDATGYVVVDREPKVGDRVVSHYSKHGHGAGAEKYDGPGAITPNPDHYVPSAGWFRVELDTVTHNVENLWLYAHEFDILEKIKPQVGDVVKHDAGTVHLPAGSTGDVIHVFGDGMVSVKWHDRSKQWSDGGFWSSGLTVVKWPEPEPEPAPDVETLKVGDIVTGYGVAPGWIGELVTIRDGYVWGEGDCEVAWYGGTLLKDRQVLGATLSNLTLVRRPEPEPLAAWEFELLYAAAGDSGIFGTVEDEAGLRALGKGAVIVSSVNGAGYVRISDNHYRTTLIDYPGQDFGYNYASVVFGAVRNGLTFIVLSAGV